jgi:hypothetical protein
VSSAGPPFNRHTRFGSRSLTTDDGWAVGIAADKAELEAQASKKTSGIKSFLSGGFGGVCCVLVGTSPGAARFLPVPESLCLSSAGGPSTKLHPLGPHPPVDGALLHLGGTGILATWSLLLVHMRFPTTTALIVPFPGDSLQAILSISPKSGCKLVHRGNTPVHSMSCERRLHAMAFEGRRCFFPHSSSVCRHSC